MAWEDDAPMPGKPLSLTEKLDTLFQLRLHPERAMDSNQLGVSS